MSPKGFHTGSVDIDAGRKLVVHPGNWTFSLGQGIEAIDLLHLVLESDPYNTTPVA